MAGYRVRSLVYYTITISTFIYLLKFVTIANKSSRAKTYNNGKIVWNIINYVMDFFPLFLSSNVTFTRYVEPVVGTLELHVKNLSSYIVLKHYLRICLHYLWDLILETSFHTSFYTSRPRLEKESEIPRSWVGRFGTVPSRSVHITDFSFESR